MTEHKKYRMGRSRFGDHSSMWIAVPGGMALALGIAALLIAVNPGPGEFRFWAALISVLCVSPPLVMGVWVLVVDRMTIPGAVRNPEVGIESAWYNKAAQTSFSVMLAATGLGSAVASVMGTWPVALTLLAVCGGLMATFGIAYAVQKCRS